MSPVELKSAKGNFLYRLDEVKGQATVDFSYFGDF